MTGLAVSDAQHEAVALGVNRLLRAGMVYRYTANERSSPEHYLGWTGRHGLLRVAAHASAEPAGVTPALRVCARLTFPPQLVPIDAGTHERMVALALGTFLLRSEVA